MSAPFTEAQKGIVRQWRTAGAALDAIKWAELRGMDDAEGQRQSAAVMEMAERWIAQNPGVTRPSGMVEQQRIFARWWKRPR